MSDIDLAAAIAKANAPVNLSVPRWMVSTLAASCEAKARKLRGEAKRSEYTGTVQSKLSLAQEWDDLAASLRAQEQTQP